MIWRDFEAAAPELAAAGVERFARTGLVLVGTLRRDGWPRISPVEIMIVDGHLYLGMTWQSKKALDLVRDPRCVVHSTVSQLDGSEGDFKVYGRADAITDLEMRSRFADAVYERLQFRPEGEYHLFSIDIESVGFVEFKDDRLVPAVWKAP